MANNLKGAKKTIGVLGGGQLGRMMALDAARLGFDLICLDPAGENASAAPVCKIRKGSFMDREDVMAMPGDVLTVEIEHVNVEALDELAKQGRGIQPAPSTLRIIGDKVTQKNVMVAAGVPVVDYLVVEPNHNSIVTAAINLGGFPVMLKARKMAYDGRGNVVINHPLDCDAALKSLGSVAVGGIFLEKFQCFESELACIVARDHNGKMACYDVCETRQADNMCRIVVVPPSFQLPESGRLRAQHVAELAVSAVDGAGVFAVEMFWMGGSNVLFNEMAPRPHNSGHLSIEACVTSQFEQHVRCVAGLPLGDTSLRVGAAAMVNIIGEKSEEATLKKMETALSVPGASIHWYGKEYREGRKLGHITVTASSMNELRNRLVAVGEPLDHKDVVPEPKEAPAVSIIMGSDSDLPVMAAAAEVLDLFEVPYELTIVSAHRTPYRMYSFANKARARGIQVIIAGAGGAAHLPGMVAAITALPVIGVPIKTSTMDGQDSLFSIVQMPKGIPVATVAIGNATNAGLLAVRIIASSSYHSPPGLASKLRVALDFYNEDQSCDVENKATHLESVRYKQYLTEYTNKDKTFLYLPRIRANLNFVLKNTELKLSPKNGAVRTAHYAGKVRDRYDDGQSIVLITTDRLSAFDRMLANIPFKGAVLNLVSLWWFNKTMHIVKNHLLAINESGNAVHPNVTLAKPCKTFPIEFVMRGYNSGSSGTSMWTHYNKGVRIYCGHKLPDGMIKNQKLSSNLCTPTTKADDHDELIDAASIVADGWMSKEDFEFCETKSKELFAFGQQTAAERGLVLVDTKYEFGRDLATGEILLIDEIHTPDSSRYWLADSYQLCVSEGREPDNIDKEFLRLWFAKRCDPYNDVVVPEAPSELVAELSRRYILLYEKITGLAFSFPKLNKNADISSEIQQVVDKALG